MKWTDVAFKILVLIAIAIFLFLYNNKANENRYSGFFSPGLGDGVTIVDSNDGTAYVFFGFRGTDKSQWLKITPYGKTAFIQ